jgi:hypothetical protein
VPVLTQPGRRATTEQLLPELVSLLRRGVPESALADMLGIWLSGTVAQLSDTPPDIDIETTIWNNEPSLRPVTRASLAAQVGTLHQVMGRAVEHITPPSIWLASNAMNYALVRRVSGFLGEPWMLRPYRRTDAERLGEELLDMVPTDPPTELSGFRNISEAWAEHLGFGQLLQFQRLDLLPPKTPVVYE